MDKRKLHLILIVVVGIIVLVIGVKAGMIYSGPTITKEALNRVSQTAYGRNYDDLNYVEQYLVRAKFPIGRTIGEKNAEFKQWLTSPRQWFIKWIVIPLVIFLVLTASLVASRVILDRLRPPSGPR